MENKPTRRCNVGREDSAAQSRIVFAPSHRHRQAFLGTRGSPLGTVRIVAYPAFITVLDIFSVFWSLLLGLDMARGAVFCGGMIAFQRAALCLIALLKPA
jgi:hypothetical protein